MNNLALKMDDLSMEDMFEIRLQAREQWARYSAARGLVLDWGMALFRDKFPLEFCREMHQYLVDTRRDTFTDTEAPRNHAKTTIKCFLVPMFQALLEPYAFNHYLNVQATDKKALAVNRAIRTEFEENTSIHKLYKPEMGRRWTDEQFVVRIRYGNDWPKEIVFTAVGAGQSMRGLNYNNIRPDYIIVDDLYNEEDIHNVESTQRKNDWFWGTLYPARAKSRRNSVHVQGTAINTEDLLVKLKDVEGVTYKSFKAVKDWDKGEVLWPELNTIEDLKKEMGMMGTLIFSREMQNERMDESTAIIKRSWLYPSGQPSWEYDPGELEARLAPGDRIQFIGARLGNDPSIGKKVENDFTGTALVVVTQPVDGNGGCDYWIEAVWNEKLSLNDRLLQLKEIYDARPTNRRINTVRIESIAGFNDYADEVIRRTNLPVDRVDRVPDKITNLENKSHFFENHKVHLNRNIPSALKDLLVAQLTNNHSKHDDVRDAVLLCLDDESGLWRFVR